MAVTQLFKEHPASVGETYVEHLGCASRIGAKMMWGGLACMLHGIFPFLFTRTGSSVLIELHAEAVERRHTSEASEKSC